MGKQTKLMDWTKLTASFENAKKVIICVTTTNVFLSTRCAMEFTIVGMGLMNLTVNIVPEDVLAIAYNITLSVMVASIVLTDQMRKAVKTGIAVREDGNVPIKDVLMNNLFVMELPTAQIDRMKRTVKTGNVVQADGNVELVNVLMLNMFVMLLVFFTVLMDLMNKTVKTGIAQQDTRNVLMENLVVVLFCCVMARLIVAHTAQMRILNFAKTGNVFLADGNVPTTDASLKKVFVMVMMTAQTVQMK